MFLINAITSIINATHQKNVKNNGIHNGDVTHHHDQLIFPVNFKIRNTINKIPQILITFSVLNYNINIETFLKFSNKKR